MEKAEMIRISLAMLLAASIADSAIASTDQPKASTISQRPSTKIDDAGTLHLPNGDEIPYSDLASPEARKNFIDLTRGYESVLVKPADWKPRNGETEAEAERRWYDETLYIPWLAKIRQQLAVNVKPRKMAGVQTDIITPAEGISDRNRNRVLINLHGGGMIVGGRYGGQLESIPISSIARIKVITVDYRMAPEHKYPAAEEDVIAVYRELLKTYRPENIGIYGCSAGAWLTGTAVAKLIAAREPTPGAIGMFGWGPFGGNAYGDSNYIFSGGKPFASAQEWNAPGSYTAGLDAGDLAAYPVEDPVIQRQFPPSLLMTGTRDIGLSKTVFAHSRLVDLGVDAELHVWEGAPHCSFAQPFVDPAVPESQQAWKVMATFFDQHLGNAAR
jgi:epsilon-lactone hydrolase